MFVETLFPNVTMQPSKESADFSKHVLVGCIVGSWSSTSLISFYVLK